MFTAVAGNAYRGADVYGIPMLGDAGQLFDTVFQPQGQPFRIILASIR